LVLGVGVNGRYYRWQALVQSWHKHFAYIFLRRSSLTTRVFWFSKTTISPFDERPFRANLPRTLQQPNECAGSVIMIYFDRCDLPPRSSSDVSDHSTAPSVTEGRVKYGNIHAHGPFCKTKHHGRICSPVQALPESLPVLARFVYVR
jgi:hypothetical protein